ncbi:glycosyltransferase [Methylobacterium sp. 285MFTsu5.1]|uniref:glycosyltransferase n=1 Tax=Methylobacterium sp. 285MFTsu5.1 TaxID=1172187 RepID=UPI0003A7C074|nr:glycosyltransferase [Methylobacterium sp. 285MFTsu5.1]
MPRIARKIKRTWTDLTEQLATAREIKNRFDPNFYRRYFGDLSHLRGDRALKRHYYRHGRVEGRPATPEALIKKLTLEHGAIPADFQPAEYRAMNPDLRHLEENYELIAHYLQFGRYENREYIHKDETVERDYRIYTKKVSSTREYPESFQEFARAKNLTSTVWIKLLNLGEFNLLNRELLPRSCQTRIEAICLFIESGVDRQLALSAKYRFDPIFYATVTSSKKIFKDPAELYRYWLNTGFGRGEAPNELEFLNGIIGEDEFPACFNEELYRRNAAKHVSVPAGRGNALRHFIEFGFAKNLDAVEKGANGGNFMNVLARRYLLRNQLVLASKASDKAVSMAQGVSSIHHTRGDVLRAQNRISDATKEFLIAAHLPNASVWSHIHAIEGLAFTLEEFEQTLKEIEFSSQQCSSSYQWRLTARRALTHLQNAKQSHYITAYKKGRRTEADNELHTDLKLITDILSKIQSFPAVLPPSKHGPILIIANRDLAQCDHYRVVQKYNYLRLGGWDAEIHNQNRSDAYRPAIDRARAVIFYRTPATPEIIHAILYARSLGLPTFYDIDDLIFDAIAYPDPYKSFQGQINEDTYAGLQYGVPLFRYAMTLCDFGIASTPELAIHIRPLVRTGICHVLRNGLDYRNDAYVLREPKPLSSDMVTIFYGSGTKAHNQDFNDLAAPALEYILREHSDVRLVIVGHLKLTATLQGFDERVYQIPFSNNVSDYWEVLSGADINLAPLARSKTTDCKSEIKWLEAAMCGIPSVVSSTATYDEALRDGEDVLIARSPDDWMRALEYLIRNPERRYQIGNMARQRAIISYSSAAAVEVLSKFLPPPTAVAAGEEYAPDLYRGSPARSRWNARMKATNDSAASDAPEQLLRDPAELKPATSNGIGGRHRVLIVNIYFPPHSIGGATRVVRDNVEYISSHYSSLFDLAVVASDVGSNNPGEISVDSYGDIPVYRIGIESKHYMDWYGFDEQMAAPFQQAIDRFNPDLIHFHCVQGLTATPVEVAVQRNIPYIVTTHDAWWISDFQFLIDEDGQLHLPSSDHLASSSDVPLGRLASLARRRRLERLLAKATKVLSVSQSFADIYRAAGVSQAVAVPNGISRLQFLRRNESRNGRVRLGHIGNRSAHKGATLLEAILRSNEFRNLSLTMVDNRYDAGYSRTETWGTTPVEIIGPVPQAKVPELYAQLDVLLAPSLWPESFGLAAREAKAAGLWVVASSLGAIGEEIEENVDGHVVEVNDINQLQGVLHRIDEYPSRYLVSPHRTGTQPRWSDDQGEDLVRIYREILRSRLAQKGLALTPN